MQPAVVDQINVTGLIPGRRTPMTIHADDMPHVMGMLTAAYSDPIMATLREPACNARDAMIVAGKGDQPIHVTLPNRLSEFLIIRDEGDGMSPEFVEDHFSRYGDSNKRAHGSTIGGFGIGAKAPLAYTDSFTIRSVCNGVYGEYLISRDKTGAAGITTVVVRLTDSPSYTEVKIPAKNLTDFNVKAEWLFKFWPEGSVLVNNEKPRRHNGVKVAEGIYYDPDPNGFNRGQSYVVMGGVPYRIANVAQYLPDTYVQKFNFIADIPINSATMTHAREDLEYTDQTKETLREVGQRFTEGFFKMVKDEIVNQPTAPQAYDSYVAWSRKIGRRPSGLIYNGVEIHMSVSMKGIYWNKYARRGSAMLTETTSIDIDDARNSLFITSTPGVTPYVKSRFALWRKSLEGSKRSYGKIYFCEVLPSSPFIGNLNVLTWKEITSVKPASQTRALAAHFEVLDESGHLSDVSVKDMKSKKNIVLITPKDFRSIKEHAAMMRQLTALGADVTLVKLPENRWAKFKRDFKDVGIFKDWVSDFLKIEIATIPKAVWEAKSLTSESQYILKKLAGKDIHDPELKRLIAEFVDATESPDRKKVANIEFLARAAKVDAKFPEVSSNDWFRTTYPLIKCMYYYNINFNELVTYLNAAYAAKKGTK